MLGLVGLRAFLAFCYYFKLSTRLWIRDSSRPFALLPGFDFFLEQRNARAAYSFIPTLRSEALAETSFLVYACLYVCVYVLLQFRPFNTALQDDCMPILYFKHVLEIFRIFESDAFGRVGIMIAACQCRRWRQDQGRMESPTVQKYEDTSLIRQILSQ